MEGEGGGDGRIISVPAVVSVEIHPRGCERRESVTGYANGTRSTVHDPRVNDDASKSRVGSLIRTRFADGRKVEDAPRRRAESRIRAYACSPLSLFLSRSYFSARSPVFHSRLRRDLPQTNHEKKREEERRGTGRETAIEKERRAGGRGGGGREGRKGRMEESAFAPTHVREKLQCTRMTRKRAASAHERNGGGGGVREEETEEDEEEEEEARGTEFILRAFFYRSLTPRSSPEPRREQHAAPR